MYCISGAMFPVSGLPGWLNVLNRIDPLTYAVDPPRRAVSAHVGAVLGLAMLAIAIAEFSRSE